MAWRLFRLYQRKRVININTNVVLAGIAAILVAKYPVHLAGEAITPALVHEHVPWIDRDFLLAIVAAMIDGLADIVIYFLLHYVANHWRPLAPQTDTERRHNAAGKKLSYFRDATLVQFERAALFPIFYFVAMGLMWLLLKGGVADHWAFSIGFITAIFTTRVLHTIWGLRSGSMLDPRERERRRLLRIRRRRGSGAG